MSEWKKYPEDSFPGTGTYLGLFDDTDPMNDPVPFAKYIGFVFAHGNIYPQSDVKVENLKKWCELPEWR